MSRFLEKVNPTVAGRVRTLPAFSAGRAIVLAVSLAALGVGPASAGKFGLGRPALPQEIAAWDLDVAPDGSGLPAGAGDVLTGEEVFAEKCASCHGDFAEGVGNWPKLAGGWDTLDHDDPVKTVGSYWPHLTSVWDYINRSMPFGDAQSLTADEVYAVTAYILYSNDLVDEDFTLTEQNLLEISLPNRTGFVVDDRLAAEQHFWTDAPCMNNCKDTVEITMRARALDVTPSEPQVAALESAAEDVASKSAADTAEAPPISPVPDPQLVAAGEKVFRKCKACHQVGPEAKSRSGPALNGIVGAPAAQASGFRYSKAMKTAAAEGLVWDTGSLSAFLAKPKAFLKGTKMSFAGLRKSEDVTAVIAYLQSQAE